MADPNAFFPLTPTSPPRHHYAVTPSDSEALPTVPRALYVNADGVITASLKNTPAVFLAYTVFAGQLLLGEFYQVKATGTTSTDIIAVY